MNPYLTDTKPDRITCLPDDLIHLILSELSIREAVRTSVLSSNWRYKWATLPNLVFEVERASVAIRHPIVNRRIVNHVLSLHFGPIKKFNLSCNRWVGVAHIDWWTLDVIGRSIEALVLTIWEEPQYRIPSRLFSCQSLQCLRLHNCWLKPPPTFEGLKNLKCLDLDRVIISEDTFEKLISTCPLLEDMVLTDLIGITKFNIHAPNLKTFELSGIFDDISFENTFQLVEVHVGFDEDNHERRFYECFSNLLNFFVHLSHIKRLHIEYLLKYWAAGVVPITLPSSCINLSYVFLNINFNDLKEISAALCVFRSSPNLRELEMFARPSKQTIASYCTEDIFYDWPAIQVRHVTIDGFSGIKSEFDFIRFVLLNSPVLQRMTVVPDLNMGLELTKELLKFTKELLKFKRASAQAEVIFMDPA